MRLIRPADTEARAAREHFTADAWLHETAEGQPEGLRATVVHFSPSARNDWHHHRGGQVLFVLTGRGRVGTRVDGGVRVDEFGPGDIVIAEPGECHWHGAVDDSAMSHLSVTAEETVWSSSGPGEAPGCE